MSADDPLCDRVALKAAFRTYIRAQIPRVLTQLDRDPSSPTAGCFDRNHWHYKIRDFPSAIQQQGLFTLDALRSGALADIGPPDAARRTLEDWAVAAINNLAGQADRSGGVSEYYPYERSFPAAAFGLYAAARVLNDWAAEAPHLLDRVHWDGLRRLTEHLARRREDEALNQFAAGVAGLALAARLDRLAPVPQLGAQADRLFAAQHAEGWFPEYGGPDFGYLSVTIDALTDYFDATEDARAERAIDRAVDFLAGLVGADGRLPHTLNSRNTDYVVSYGLARAGTRNPTASWLIVTLFGGLGEPHHPVWATDDRYATHYIFASIVRSYVWLDRLSPPRPPEQQRSPRWLPGCGYLIARDERGGSTIYAAAKKGGLLRIHRENASPIVDHGWRVSHGDRMWTSNWWSEDWRCEHQGDRVVVSGKLVEVGHHQVSPLRHLALRAAAWLLGERLIPLLKRAMIFRPKSHSGPAFERRIDVTGTGVSLVDRFVARAGALAEVAPRQNLRHVASADSFHVEELRPPLLGTDTRLALDAPAEVEAHWRPGETPELRVDRRSVPVATTGADPDHADRPPAAAPAEAER